jgi:tetratricopeptide (TPR) repeat protein
VRPNTSIALWLAALLLVCGARAEARTPREEAQARELYKKGMTHYQLGELDKAIEEFKQAYEITSAPALLFNLAQVHRMKKNLPDALYFYKMYLRLEPNAGNRKDVEGLIAETQARLDEEERAKQQQQQQQVAPVVVTPPPAPVPVPEVRAAPRATHWKAKLWSGVALAAVGLGALAGGIALGASAASDADQLARASAQGTNSYNGPNQALYRDGQNAQAASTALYVTAGALVATGAVLGALGLHDRAAARVAVVPSVNGAQAVMSCAF